MREYEELSPPELKTVRLEHELQTADCRLELGTMEFRRFADVQAAVECDIVKVSS